MNLYHATTNDPAMGAGSTIGIRSGVLKRGDLLDVRHGEHAPFSARIDHMGLGRLVIERKGRKMVCRPWRSGDAAVDRLGGASSSWTVERVEDNALAGAD